MVSGLLDLYVLFSLELNPIAYTKRKSHVCYEARNQAVKEYSKYKLPGMTENRAFCSTLEQETAGTK